MPEPVVTELPAPTPVGVPVYELIRMVTAGEVKLPMFQRGFVWSHEQVRNLFDSVYRGYPVGMLLFWQTFTRLPQEEDLGGFRLPKTPEMQPTNYVLDGQQRLVSLFGGLTPFDQGQTDKFPIFFDLRERNFTHDGGADFPHRFPMSVLSDIPSFFAAVEPLRNLPDGEELERTAQQLSARFQNYQVPVLTIREKEAVNVAPIFERINSSATRLTLFDFMVAVLWAPDFNFKQRVADIRDALEPKGFDGIAEETVIRALSTVVLGSAKRETMMTQLRDRDRGQLDDDMAATRAALERAVDFLSSDVRVISDDLLPYERQLVLLTYIFFKIAHPNAAQIRVLQRWFWRTSFSERYRRGGEGLFDDDLQTAEEALENADLLERFGTPPGANVVLNAEFRTPSAFTKAFVAMLACRRPLNLRTGRPIDVERALSPYNRRQFHHIFPKGFLKDRYPRHDRTNSLVNICMLGAEDNRAIGARAPSDYLVELRGVHGDQFDVILGSNFIPPGCWPFIESDDFDGFLAARADHLQRETANLFY